MTALANRLGKIMMAHRLGVLDPAETQQLLPDSVSVGELHNQVETPRAARRENYSRTAASLKHALQPWK